MRVPEFNASCTYSHSRKDDPIVFPGLPGASHMHSFFGNRSTDANSTADTLLANAGTSCAPAPDLSAYWVPTLYERGVAVEPKARRRLLRLAAAPTRARPCRSRRASG